MRSFARGIKGVLVEYLKRGVCEAHFYFKNGGKTKCQRQNQKQLFLQQSPHGSWCTL